MAVEQFFVMGGTIPEDSPSYLPRQADTQLLQTLRQGEFCYVLDTRQMGKSSLVPRAAAQLRREGRRVAIVDLTAYGKNLTPEQWYRGMLQTIGEHTDLEDTLIDAWKAQRDLSPLQRFFVALRAALEETSDTEFVLFVDEVDFVRSLAFDTDEFFAGIREWYNRRATDPCYRELTFCLLGTASPKDLIKDRALTPFNIGQRIELRDMTLEELQPLTGGICPTAPKEAARLLERVYYWTGGHPYLTQTLCSELAQVATKTNAHSLNAGTVDTLVRQRFFTRQALKEDHNLPAVADRILQKNANEPGTTADSERRSALLTLYRQVVEGKRVGDDETDDRVTMLKLSGIVRAEQGLLQIRNRVYRQIFNSKWIEENLPHAESRRQKEAARNAFLRAATLFGTIMLMFACLTGYAFYLRKQAGQEKEKANSNADRAEHLAYSSDMNLLQQYYEAPIPRIKECRQLLKETSTNFAKGFEWGYWNRMLHLDLLTLTGHAKPVTSVAFSADGQKIVTGSLDNTAKVWDAKTGRATLTLTGHRDIVNSVAFSPDGQKIVTGSSDNTAKVWDAKTGRATLTLTGHAGPVTSVAFSPDGQRIVTGSKDTMARVWNARTGRAILTLTGHQYTVTSVAFSADGQRIVTGSWDTMVRVWDAKTGRSTLTLTGHAGPVTSVAFSPDGQRIVTGSKDNTAKVWDAKTGHPTFTLTGHAGPVTSVAFFADGQKIVTGSSDNTARVWDAKTGRAALTLTEHAKTINSVAFSADGQKLVTGSDDHTAKVWDAKTGRAILTLTGHAGPVLSVAFSADGQRIVTGNWDNTAKVWDAKTGRATLTLTGHAKTINSVAFSADGQKLVTGSSDNTARVWDAKTGRATLTLTGHAGPVWSAAFSPDGQRIVTRSDDRTAKVWDAKTGRVTLTLTGHQYTVLSVAFSADGQRIVTGSSDNTAKVWDAKTGRATLTLTGHAGPVWSAAFSTDGQKIVTGSNDRTAKVWDAKTGRATLTLTGHKDIVNFVAFSPDGQRIVTRSDDTMVRVWVSDAHAGEQQAATLQAGR